MRTFFASLLAFSALQLPAQTDTATFPGREFVYEYSVTRKGEPSLFVFQEPFASTDAGEVNAAWGYCSPAQTDICSGDLVVRVGLKFSDHLSADSMYYTNYLYYNITGETVCQSVSGSVVSTNEVWLHPPRTKGFRILECAPFPHIRFDSTNWAWTLEVGGHWGDARWKQWEGNVEFGFEYQKTGEETLLYKGRPYSCTVVEAKATSPLGSSGAQFWYSPPTGFLKMEFYNIDNSIMTMNLVEIRE